MSTTIIEEFNTKCTECIVALNRRLSRLRMGRANPVLLEHITVSYYGSMTPLNNVASIHVQDAHTLIVRPWDRELLAPIEKAIQAADLGLNPVSGGDALRIQIPILTGERRRELARRVWGEGESAKQTLLAHRRTARGEAKALEMGADETRIALKIIESFLKPHQKRLREAVNSKLEEIEK